MLVYVLHFFLVLFKIYVIILIFRSSEDIFAVLPSLPEVSRAVTITHSWMDRSKPYIARSSKVCGDVLEFSELKVRAISMGNFPLFNLFTIKILLKKGRCKCQSC